MPFSFSFPSQKWVQLQNCKRKQIFAESTRCNPMDVSCLRTSFSSIRIIQARVDNARAEFVHAIRNCDECAPLRMNFMKWLRRMRLRRDRIHRSILRCPLTDMGCHRRRVHRIKQLQSLIEKRRKSVLHLHGRCKREGTRIGVHHTQMFTVSPLPDHPDPWLRWAKRSAHPDDNDGSQVFRMAAASATSVSVLVVLGAALLAAML